MERARELCASQESIAAAVYNVLLDVLLYVNNNNNSSNIPSPGLSQIGNDRLKGYNNNTFLRLKLAVLELIATHKHYRLFTGKNNSNNSNRSRMVALLIVATGDTIYPQVSERAAVYLKQYLDNKNNNSDDISSLLIGGNPTMLAMELLALCVGQVHAESALLSATTTASSSWNGLGSGHHNNVAVQGLLSQQQIMSTKRRPVAESVATAMISFTATELLDGHAHWWNNTVPVDLQNTAMLGLQVASRSLLASGTASSATTAVSRIGLSKLRAKPYIASAKLLNSLAIRLAVCVDSSSSKDSSSSSSQESVVIMMDLMGKCLATACSVLAPIASTPSSSGGRSNNGSDDGSIAVRDLCYGVIGTLSRSNKFAKDAANRLFARGVTVTDNNTSIIETATMLFGCCANE